MRNALTLALALGCVLCGCLTASAMAALDVALLARTVLVVLPAIVLLLVVVRIARLEHNAKLAAVLVVGCVLCFCSVVRTVERNYRLGYVGSFVMCAKVIHESFAISDEPIRPVRLSDLTTVRPCEGGAR